MSNLDHVKITTTSEYEQLSNLLHDYILELHKINENVKVRSPIQIAQEYFYDTDSDFYLSYDDNELIGFCILGHGNSCHKDVDVYINEFCILKEHRNMGYGEKVISSILSQRGDTSVCFHILNNNSNALKFWAKTFRDWENITDTIIDTSNSPSFLNWSVYKLSEE